jgi:hypothetical protein
VGMQVCNHGCTASLTLRPCHGRMPPPATSTTPAPRLSHSRPYAATSQAQNSCARWCFVAAPVGCWNPRDAAATTRWDCLCGQSGRGVHQWNWYIVIYKNPTWLGADRQRVWSIALEKQGVWGMIGGSPGAHSSSVHPNLLSLIFNLAAATSLLLNPCLVPAHQGASPSPPGLLPAAPCGQEGGVDIGAGVPLGAAPAVHPELAHLQLGRLGARRRRCCCCCCWGLWCCAWW